MAGKTLMYQGQIMNMLVAGDTLNIFLLTGISNVNIFFQKED